MVIAVKIVATSISSLLGLIALVSLIGGRLDDREFKAMLFVFAVVLMDLLAIWG